VPAGVPWILHLSDPHLGHLSPGQTLDDEKVILEGEPDLETTQRVFERTLRDLQSFVVEHGRPDVAVVSGDLTYHADPSGFTAFGALLQDRKDVLPRDRKRIVVVPGNHDVVWEEKPGTRARYRRFLGATRARACCTPLLDGVDFDPGSGAPLPERDRHPHVVETADLLVVALNSSNYCGDLTTARGAMSEDEWRDALAPTEDARNELLEELKRLRRQDIARVSRRQIEALGQYFEDHGLERERSQDDRLRVAVLHHQLLPVSTREERKAFESLMNLGLVRRTLAEYGIDVVLHGHKHESGMYWDLAAEADDDLNAPRRRVLVISSPGHFNVDTPAMRAIMLEGTSAARNVRILTFLGSGSHRRNARHDVGQLVPLWSSDTPGREQTMIVAPTAHAGYARLRSLFELREGEEQRNIVCQIDDPADAPELPPSYPKVAVDDPHAWFNGLVDWWQLERSELVSRGLMAFNHGERIRRRWGDQIQRAITILNQREGSSRALIQLVAPRETGRYAQDDRDLSRGSFPAFVLAEFGITERDGERQLDCFGYFRKQEMRYWWPVNLAELARLQQQVRAGVEPAAATGRIVTFSAIALWKGALPRVAVPVVDQFVEQPGRLLAMAVAVAFPGAASPAAIIDWRDVLRDLAGVERSGPPQSSAGVDRLYDDVTRLAPTAAKGLKDVAGALEDLRDEYAAHADREELTAAAARNVDKRVKRLTVAVTAVLPGAAP
jgi:3',5'-cyclic AMP phosphodiesterase CpdA